MSQEKIDIRDILIGDVLKDSFGRLFIVESIRETSENKETLECLELLSNSLKKQKLYSPFLRATDEDIQKGLLKEFCTFEEENFRIQINPECKSVIVKDLISFSESYFYFDERQISILLKTLKREIS